MFYILSGKRTMTSHCVTILIYRDILKADIDIKKCK